MEDEQDPPTDEAEASSIEKGLRAAYQRRAPAAAESKPPRVLLREIAAEHAPVLRVPVAGAEGLPPVGPRYHLHGEIARGGIGVVLKGRDVDLGRDVAVKILREEHAGDADVVFRFIEEAQIGGQLQHPGIVPVYDLGTSGENRPYFAMKLVKGRTLAAMFEDRRSSPAERRRSLAVFESVCRTVAYAHARGVIHRDLKPSNVMVGAFGEVQVVDWGLAKVLGQESEDRARVRRPRPEAQSVITTVRSGSSGSHSLVGSVMGTPAYMSPEQARGEIEKVDTRGDVFALGAILCEILTGAPPYVGTDAEIARQASRAELGGALRRLEDCDAHESLVDLCKACLAPQKQDRPKDAGEVADGVAAYLAAVERRAEQARVDGAKARVRAEGDRHARRLVWLIAGCAAAALLAGGGGFAWLRGSATTRARASRTAATEALAEATLLRGRASSSGDVRAIAEARSAGKRAVDLAAPLDASDPARVGADQLLKDLYADEAKARAAAETKARDAATAARLASIRLDDAARPDPARRAAALAAALREHGIDVETLSAEETARRVRGSAIRGDLVDALDAWAGPTEETRGRARAAVAAARAADPDPWRDALRAAVGRGQVRAAGDVFDAEKQPASAAVLLAERLDAAGDSAQAAQVLWKAFLVHPENFWINVVRARLLLVAKPPQRRFALRHLAAAAAVEARSARALDLVGSLELAAGDSAAAVRTLSDAVARDPALARAHADLGDALAQTGDVAKALAEHREAVQRVPDDTDFARRLAESLVLAKQWTSAVSTAADAATRAPQSAAARRVLAQALLGSGDVDGAVAEARKAVLLDDKDARALVALGCSLDAKGGADEAVKNWSEAAKLDPDLIDAHRALAAAYERRRDFDSAADERWELVRLLPEDAATHIALATALRRKGDPGGAAEEAEEAARLDDGAAAVHVERARSLLAKDDFDGAAAAARRAMELSKTDVEACRVLAAALVAGGRDDDALAALEEAARLAPADPDDAVRVARRLEVLGRFADAASAAHRASERAAGRADIAAEAARLATRCDALARNDAKLPQIVAGSLVPRDATETVLFGRLCLRRGNAARAAELFTKGLAGGAAADVEEQWGRLYDAACAAAAAGTRRGKDELAPPLRETRRNEALARLRSILDDWTKRVDESDAKSVPRLAERLESWNRDRALACVRGSEELSFVPERDDWRELWKDVDALMERAEEAP
jgi:serine/threonine-protein kinase